jgi:hypothetical protein
MINLLGELFLPMDVGNIFRRHSIHASKNKRIRLSYGLPGLANVPNGYSALAEIYGKGTNRTPLLVAFGFPLDWVVTLPSQDVNGEDGTIQAGEYAKGDTATFFVVPNAGRVEVSCPTSVCACF